MRDASSNSKTRNELLDALKGVAILLVVIGHCIQYGSGSGFYNNEAFYDNALFRAIYSFHMPLFMLISGYLSSYSVQKYNWKHLAVSRFRQLLVPILSWSVISSLIKIIQAQFRVGFAQAVLLFSDIFVHDLWFLWAILICSTLLIFGHYLFRDHIAFYGLVFAVSFFVPDRLGLELYKFMYPYYVIGYFANCQGWAHSVMHHSKRKLIFSGVLIVYAGLMIFFNRDSFIYTTGHTLLHKNVLKQLTIDLYRYAVGLTGSLAAIFCVHSVFHYLRPEIKRVLCDFGMRSLGIYAVSGILFSYVLWPLTVPLAKCSAGSVVVETFLVMLASFAITRWTQMNKITNRLLLGGR